MHLLTSRYGTAHIFNMQRWHTLQCAVNAPEMQFALATGASHTDCTVPLWRQAACALPFSIHNIALGINQAIPGLTLPHLHWLRNQSSELAYFSPFHREWQRYYFLHLISYIFYLLPAIESGTQRDEAVTAVVSKYNTLFHSAYPTRTAAKYSLIVIIARPQILLNLFPSRLLITFHIIST